MVKLGFGTVKNMLHFRYPDKPYRTTSDVVNCLREDEWLAQSKYDGWRISLYVGVSESTLFSSRGKSLVDILSVPKFILDDISELSSYLPSLSVLDGEYVGPRGNHKPHIYFFDCLAWSGQWNVNVPYIDRWNQTCDMGRYMECCSSLSLACTQRENFLSFFNELKNDWYNNGNDLYEGIVLKRLSGKLVLSLNRASKNRHMMKLKYREIKEKIEI